MQIPIAGAFKPNALGVELSPYSQFTVRAIPKFTGGRLNVIMHGGEISSLELSKLILNSPGYSPQTPVRLISCGGSEMAQRLANFLEAEVLATADDVAVLGGVRGPVYPPPSKWSTYSPNK